MSSEIAPVRAWKETRPALRVYRFLQFLASPIIRGVFTTKRRGHRTIPKTGPAILVSNHASNIDPVLVVGSIPRPIFHLGKHTLFTTPNRARFFQQLGGQIPVNRARGGNRAAIDAAVKCIEDGFALGIYPEGGRTPDGRLCRAHPGVARIAVRTGAPVFPVAIEGTFEMWPKGQKLPKLFRPTKVIVGAPRQYPKQPERVDDTEEMQRIADELMADVAKLLGKPYEPATAQIIRRSLE